MSSIDLINFLSNYKNGIDGLNGESSQRSGVFVSSEGDSNENMSIDELIDKFSAGEIQVDAFIPWFRQHQCSDMQISQQDGMCKISFKFQGKAYQLSFNVENDEPSLHGTSEQNNNDKVFEEYSNNLILLNYVSGKNKNGSENTALNTTSDGQRLTADNYLQYAAEINKLVGSDQDALRKQAVETLIKDYSKGDIDAASLDMVLAALGVNCNVSVSENGNSILMFSLEGKNYKIVSNSEFGIDGIIGSYSRNTLNGSWLLTALQSLSNSDAGKNIIQNSISIDNDGNVTVSFNGIGISYTITQDELSEAQKSGAYSFGDNDVLSFELATERLRREITAGVVTLDYGNYGSRDTDTGKPGEGLKGGYSEYMLYYLTGNTPMYESLIADSYLSKETIYEQLTKYKDDLQSGDALILTSIKAGTHQIKTVDNQVVEISLSGSIGLPVMSVSDNTVRFMNPIDSKEYEMTFEEFSKLALKRVSIVSTATPKRFETQENLPININTERLFASKTELTAAELIDSLAKESEPNSKFKQIIDKAIEQYGIKNHYDAEDLCKTVIMFLNKSCGVDNSYPVTLSKSTAEKLNEKDIQAEIQNIINSDEFKKEYYCGIDGNIDGFGQGQTGDSWILAALVSLNNSESGRQIIRDSISTDEKGNIIITFKGIGMSYTITPEEMVEAGTIDAYVRGDNDVQAFELATEKLRRDITAGKVTLEYGNYGGKAGSDDGSAGAGIKGGYTYYMLYYLTGNEHSYLKWDANGLAQNDVENYLNTYQQGLNEGKMALTLSLSKGSYNALTVDGKTFNPTLSGNLAFSITNITDSTVTIVNPWYSEEEYTLTREAFAKLGIYSLRASSIDLNPEVLVRERENYVNQSMEKYSAEFKENVIDKFKEYTSDVVSLFKDSKISYELYDKIMNAAFSAVNNNPTADILSLPKLSEYIKTENNTFDDTAYDNLLKFGVDGKIGKFKRENSAGSYIISAIISLSSTEAGRQIIKNSISVDSEGNVTVTFQGIGISYTYSQAELDEAANTGAYSSGDNDLLALELAIEQIRRDISAEKVTLEYGNIGSKDTDTGKPGEGLSGGNATAVLYYLTGNTPMFYNSTAAGVINETIVDKLNLYREHIISGSVACTIGIKKGDYTFNTVDGRSISLSLPGNISCAVTGLSDGTVTLYDPMSLEYYTISYDELNKLTINSLVITSTGVNNESIQNRARSSVRADVEALFGNKEELTVPEFIRQLESDLSEGNSKIRQLIDIFTYKMNISNYYDYHDVIKSLFIVANRQLGISNTYPVTISKLAIQLLNEKGIIDELKNLLNSAEFQNEYYYSVDGYIDDFGQGSTGDCWLLASLIALSASEGGRQLIRSSVSVDENGCYVITFKGIGISYTVTPEEMLEAKNNAGAYSKGDLDVQAFELATEKLRRDIAAGKVTLNYGNYGGKAGSDDGTAGGGIKGGYATYMIYYLTGNEPSYYKWSNDSLPPEDVEDFMKQYNTTEYAVGFSLGKGHYELPLVGGGMFKLDLSGGHALAITEITSDTVTFVNPHHADIKYTVYIKDFIKMPITKLHATLL